MRLGTRWTAGETPHESVPVVLHEAIAAQEAAYPTAAAWTLTWLEGRARCELDGLVRVAQSVDGTVSVQILDDEQAADDSDDDDWLGS